VVSSLQTSSLTWAISDATSALWHATQHAHDISHPDRDAIAALYNAALALETKVLGR
jgi:hypothetical protein